MKSIVKCFCAAAAIFAAVNVFAAEVKINDKAFPVKSKNFSKVYVFSTLDKAASELQLAKENMYQHSKHKHIAGVVSDLTLKITSSAPVKSFRTYANACNYADRKERTYVTEYSQDNKNWTEIASIKKAGGWAACNSKVIAMKENNGTFYIRFRKVLDANDKAGLSGAVVLKKFGFTLNF